MCAQRYIFPAALQFLSFHALCHRDITVFQLKKSQKLLLMTAHDIPILGRGLEASDPKMKEEPSSSFHQTSPGKVTIYLMWTENFGKGSCALGCPGCRGAVELNPGRAENGSQDLRCKMRGQRMAVRATARSLSPGSGPGPTLSLLWGPLSRPAKEEMRVLFSPSN